MHAPIIERIVRQHAEEAAFLRLLRRNATNAPHYSLQDLADLDERVEAHIDGLRVAGVPGWDLCVEQLEHAEVGEIFAAGVIALESERNDRLTTVFDVAASAGEAWPGLVSAFGWQSPDSLRGRMQPLLTSASAVEAFVGVAACAVHRVDPGPHLVSLIHNESLRVRCRALRAAGELKRSDLAPAIVELLDSEHHDERFWAAWALTINGERRGHSLLSAVARTPGPAQQRALDLILRALPVDEAVALVRELAADPKQLRTAIQGTGIVGIPSSIPWLIHHMETAEHARVAGESFSSITGVDLAYDDLDQDAPDGFESGPSEDPQDDNVEMDADEDLPWPNPRLVEERWQAIGNGLEPQRRYLAGKPVSAENCFDVLRTGQQRQRRAAAMEIALLRRNEMLWETRAPGKRQMNLLSSGAKIYGLVSH